jgi:hypothetical protein
VVRVYDGAGNVIETHEHNSEFKEWLLASNQFVRNEMNLRNGDKLQVIAPLLSEAEEAQVVFVTGITRPSLLGLKFRIYILTP